MYEQNWRAIGINSKWSIVPTLFTGFTKQQAPKGKQEDIWAMVFSLLQPVSSESSFVLNFWHCPDLGPFSLIFVHIMPSSLAIMTSVGVEPIHSHSSHDLVFEVTVGKIIKAMIIIIVIIIISLRGTWRRGECPRARVRGTMFDSLLRLRYSKPFHFDAYNEGPTWGVCMSPISGVRNSSGRHT